MPASASQALASTDMAVVLPLPAGAKASCTRCPEVPNWRTSWACPGLRSTLLAMDSNSAISTASAEMVAPSTARVDSRMNCSASRIRAVV